MLRVYTALSRCLPQLQLTCRPVNADFSRLQLLRRPGSLTRYADRARHERTNMPRSPYPPRAHAAARLGPTVQCFAVMSMGRVCGVPKALVVDALQGVEHPAGQHEARVGRDEQHVWPPIITRVERGAHAARHDVRRLLSCPGPLSIHRWHRPEASANRNPTAEPRELSYRRRLVRVARRVSRRRCSRW